MKSLREEIYNHLWMLTDESRNHLTDKIISKIEKRIDELLPVGEHQLITITKWRLKEILK